MFYFLLLLKDATAPRGRRLQPSRQFGAIADYLDCVIRFWRVADGALRHQFDQRTGIGGTSPIAWSPDAAQFIYGTCEGPVLVARTPAP